MAFKASFKFSDSREFDVLTWRVKFNRDVDPKGRPASDIYGGTIYVEVEAQFENLGELVKNTIFVA